MKWNEMLKELKIKKNEFMNKVINEIDLDVDSAALLKLISEISTGVEFVDPDKLKPELG